MPKLVQHCATPLWPCLPLCSLLQSAIEDTLARINLLGGVEGYVVVDNAVSRLHSPDVCVSDSTVLQKHCASRDVAIPGLLRMQGTILRQSKSLSPGDAAIYAKEMAALTAKARHVVRDLNPKVRVCLHGL